MYKDLVLSGGSIKGLCSFIGCIKHLEKTKRMDGIKTLVGASAGAIICFMICCGMKSNDMIEYFKIYIRKYQEHEVDFENIINIFNTVGLDDGKFLFDIFKSILKFRYQDKDDITFIELAKTCGRHLVICGSNLTKVKTDFFSVDTTPNMSVLLALRISASLPFIFTPVVHNGCVYADAALFNNFPIDYVPTHALKTTLGICIRNISQQCSYENVNLLQYVNTLINTAFDKMNQKPHQTSHDVVEIEFKDANPYNFDIHTFKFVIDESMFIEYMNRGMVTLEEFFKRSMLHA